MLESRRLSQNPQTENDTQNRHKLSQNHCEHLEDLAKDLGFQWFHGTNGTNSTMGFFSDHKSSPGARQNIILYHSHSHIQPESLQKAYWKSAVE